MQNEFVPYEIAVELKELGFNKPCLAHYNEFGELCYDVYMIEEPVALHKKDTLAPLYQQVIRWLWEAKKIWFWVKQDWFEGEFQGWVYCFEDEEGIVEAGNFDSPQEAQQTGIKELLTIKLKQ